MRAEVLVIKMQYSQMSREELLRVYDELLAQYEDYKAKGLSLDLSRGKPGAVQLDMLEEFPATIRYLSGIE